MSDSIKTPRGTIIQTGGASCRLTWNPDFGPQASARYSRAQMFLDSEVLRLSTLYTPIKTSMLIKSGILGTVFGSGTVQWIAPYAKPQYYNTADTRSYDPKRGGHWFERMKADHGKAIIAKTKRMAGGGGK